MKSEKRPNVHKMFMPTEFYLAIIDVQSKMRIGRSAAVLWLINEGLWKHGFIDEATYEVYRDRYSQPLLELVNQKRAAKETVRCGWRGCRRIAIRMVKYRDRDILPTCPEHLEVAKQSPKFEILRQREVSNG